MDISNWPLHQVMALPDHCFGRKWPVGVAMEQTVESVLWDISEIALPEMMVIWHLEILSANGGFEYLSVKLALGDQLPTTTAMFDELEPVFRDIGFRQGLSRYVALNTYSPSVSIPMRLPVSTSGRRLVGQFEQIDTGESYSHAIIVVSSMPKEVPDCLFSA